MGVGFVAFILGAVFSYQSVAVIGAVMIVGVGAVITTSGVEHRTGEVVTNSTANETVHEFTYERTETPTNLPLGTLFMLLGGVLALRGLYDIGPGGRQP
jgi:hypothetical protein